MLQALLLDLPPELLQRELLPLLSLRTWGSLMLTCRALHALAADAPDCVLHAAASQTLPHSHPIFRAKPREHLALQSRMDAAIAAGPGTWSWQRIPDISDFQDKLLSRPSPDWTKLAIARHGRLRMRDLHTREPLLEAPVLVNAVPRSPTGSAHCCWADDSQALFWFTETQGTGCQVSYYHMATGQRSSLDLPTSYIRQPVGPCVLPGSHSLLLALRPPPRGRSHVCVVEPAGPAHVSTVDEEGSGPTPRPSTRPRPQQTPFSACKGCRASSVPEALTKMTSFSHEHSTTSPCGDHAIEESRASRGTVSGSDPGCQMLRVVSVVGKAREPVPLAAHLPIKLRAFINGRILELLLTLKLPFWPLARDLIVCSPDWCHVVRGQSWVMHKHWFVCWRRRRAEHDRTPVQQGVDRSVSVHNLHMQDSALAARQHWSAA